MDTCCLRFYPVHRIFFFFFFFNDTATTEIYPLPLHDALPISSQRLRRRQVCGQDPASAESPRVRPPAPMSRRGGGDRKSTRLNSSHGYISYAVFCLKKKKRNRTGTTRSSKACTC